MRNLAIGMTVTMLLGAAQGSWAETIVTNGDFSVNAASFTVAPGYTSDNEDIFAWTYSGGGSAGINGIGLSTPFGPADQSAASYYAFLQSSGQLAQNIGSTLAVDSTYQISFLAASRANKPEAMGRVTVTDDSTTYYDSGTQQWSSASFQLVNAQFFTGSAFDGDVVITLANGSAGGGFAACYSDIEIEKIGNEAVFVLSPSDLDIALYDPATLATGVVEAAFSYGQANTNVQITAVDVIDQQHPGAFSAVDFTSPLTLTSPFPATEPLNIEFDRTAVAGMAIGETSTGMVEVVWNEVGGIDTFTNTVPVTATYYSDPTLPTVFTAAVDDNLANAANWTLGLPGHPQFTGTIDIDGSYNSHWNDAVFGDSTVTVDSGAVLTLANSTAVRGPNTLVVNDATINSKEIFAIEGTIIFNEGSVSTASARMGSLQDGSRIVFNGGTHTAANQFYVHSAGSGTNGVDFLGGTVTAGGDLQIQSTTENSVGGGAIIEAGSFTVMGGFVDFIPGWSGSWKVASFGVGDWEAALTTPANGFALDGAAIDAASFAANFFVSPDGTTLVMKTLHPPGEIAITTTAGGDVEISWTGVANHIYAVEYKTDLVSQIDWLVDTNVTGVGLITVTVDNGDESFYQVSAALE